MAWILDAFSSVGGGYSPACVTSKPIELGGLRGRRTATGRGVGMVIADHMDSIGRSLQGLRVAIQGFGNLGMHAAVYLAERGCDIVAVADVMGGIVARDSRPLSIPELVDHARTTGSVVGFPGSESITNEELIAMPCDVLIPAALEGVLHEGTADAVRAGLVVEAANMPTTAAADEILRRKGITVIPDILANAGGVIASYFEWSQNLQQTQWPARKVDRQLRSILGSAYREISKIASTRNLTLRQAAYVLAVDRVAKAESLRGHAPAKVYTRRAPAYRKAA